MTNLVKLDEWRQIVNNSGIDDNSLAEMLEIDSGLENNVMDYITARRVLLDSLSINDKAENIANEAAMSVRLSLEDDGLDVEDVDFKASLAVIIKLINIAVNRNLGVNTSGSEILEALSIVLEKN